jgi:hypothetical protein
LLVYCFAQLYGSFPVCPRPILVVCDLLPGGEHNLTIGCHGDCKPAYFSPPPCHRINKGLPQLAPPQVRQVDTHKPVLCGGLRHATTVYGEGHSLPRGGDSRSTKFLLRHATGTKGTPIIRLVLAPSQKRDCFHTGEAATTQKIGFIPWSAICIYRTRYLLIYSQRICHNQQEQIDVEEYN